MARLHRVARWQRGPRAWVLSLQCLASGCTPSVYLCQEDRGCEGAAPGGLCEDTGFCSFPDDTCPTGRRYGDFAGDGLGGTCVDSPTSEEIETDTTTGLTTSLPATTTQSEETTGGSSSSSGEGEPGDGESTGSTQRCPDDWWDCAWTHRQRASLEPMPLTESITGLPIPVRFDAQLLLDPSFAVVNADGKQLAWEADDDIAWVAADVVPKTALEVWGYAGNTAAPPKSPGLVWDSAYVGVWHLSTGADASRHENVAVSDRVQHDVGLLGQAAQFDGIDDHFDIAASDSLADLRSEGFTIEVLANPTDDSLDAFRRIAEKSDQAGATMGWTVILLGDAPNHRIETNYGLSEDERQVYSVPFEAEGWIHIVIATHPGDTPEFWVNGEPLVATVEEAGVGKPVSDAMQPMTFGGPSFPSESPRFFDGELDELRITRGIRSASWVTGTYTTTRPDAVTVDLVEEQLR